MKYEISEVREGDDEAVLFEKVNLIIQVINTMLEKHKPLHFQSKTWCAECNVSWPCNTVGVLMNEALLCEPILSSYADTDENLELIRNRAWGTQEQ